MTAAPATTVRFDIGRVIARLLKVLGDNFAAFILLAILLVGLTAVLLTFFELTYASPAALVGAPASDVLQTLFAPARIAYFFAALFIRAAANMILQGAVIYGAVTDLTGRRPTFGECLATGLRFLLPLLGIAIVSTVGIFVGYLLLIVPGVILSLAWCVAAPVAVVERKGVFESLSRSLDLTRNHRLAILGLAIVLFVAEFVMGLVLSAALGIGSSATAMANLRNEVPFGGLFWAQSVASFIEQTLVACVTSAGVASIYFELRQAKEGLAAEQLAAVFD